jgi:hypothetical protein
MLVLHKGLVDGVHSNIGCHLLSTEFLFGFSEMISLQRERREKTRNKKIYQKPTSHSNEAPNQGVLVSNPQTEGPQELRRKCTDSLHETHRRENTGRSGQNHDHDNIK